MPAPCSTISTHSVSGLSITHGLSKKNDSFCTPPLSVITICAFRSSSIISKNEAGGNSLMRFDASTLSHTFGSRFTDSSLAVRGCSGNTMSILSFSAMSSKARNMLVNRSLLSVLLSRWMVASTYPPFVSPNRLMMSHRSLASPL